MTIAQTLKAIKALGLQARYNRELREYRVSPIGCRVHSHCFVMCELNEAQAYYTDDGQDALNTAIAMRKELGIA